MLLRLEHTDLILASFYKEAAPVKAQVEKWEVWDGAS